LKEVIADLWNYPADIRVVTTNGILNSQGCLVMGAGVALAAKNKYPWLPKILGDYVKQNGNIPYLNIEQGIATVPTKHHWKNPSDIDLIVSSIKLLNAMIETVDAEKKLKIVSTQFGCGNGKLNWQNVKNNIEHLLNDQWTIVSQI